MRALLSVAVLLAACTISEPQECERPEETLQYMVGLNPGVWTGDPLTCGFEGEPGSIVLSEPLAWFVEPTIDQRVCEGVIDVSDDACSMSVDITCCRRAGLPTPDDCYGWVGKLERTEASRYPHRAEDAYDGLVDAWMHPRGVERPADCFVADEQIKVSPRLADLEP